MGCEKVSLHAVLVLVCLFGLLFTAFGSHALAGDNGAAPATSYTSVVEGSTPTPRSVTDSYSGQLNIYIGGSLPVGTHLVGFRFLFDHTTFGNTSGYITPLLFEYKSVEAATIYTVVGIGKSYDVELQSTPQVIPFEIVEGTKVPTSGNFTFGFITAMVDSSGIPVVTSQGVVDYDASPDGGTGVGGTLTTNDWDFTLGGPSIVVNLGTSFGLAAADFLLGQIYRTYSAEALGVVAAQ